MSKSLDERNTMMTEIHRVKLLEFLIASHEKRDDMVAALTTEREMLRDTVLAQAARLDAMQAVVEAMEQDARDRDNLRRKESWP